MHQVCLDEGAENLPLPTKPLTFTQLLEVLREKQLIDTNPHPQIEGSLSQPDELPLGSAPPPCVSAPKGIPPPGPPASSSKQVENDLPESFRAEVS